MPPLRRLAASLAAFTALAGPGWAQDGLRLAAPAEMAESGFLTHILPRFKFKHRIGIEPVEANAPADIAFSVDTGVPVFAESDGSAAFRLHIRAAEGEAAAAAAKFLDWLRSAPGRAAVEGFPPGGPPRYTTAAVVEEAPEEVVVEGDAVLGSRLAIVHCGRCHVVDRRNRMGGIGSAPSFGALRARPAWHDLFAKFWSENPHPSFVEVVGVTEPFDDNHPSHIHPVRVTPDEIDAILAFVATLTPKDLGAPMQLD